jgi:AraC-like DNA-binding protein
MIRRVPDDDFFIALMLQGSATLGQSGKNADCHAGDVVIYDSARPFSWQFNQDSVMQIARIPREVLTARLPHAERLTARIVGASQPLGTMTGNLLKCVSDLDQSVQTLEMGQFSKSFVDLLASAIEFSLLDPKLSLPQSDILNRAKKILIDNIEDADFNFAQLVEQINASPRTVCRVFASDGTTPMRWLWQKRLELAHGLLLRGHIRSVSQIAMRCGFADFSHFSRAFKKAYGIPPKAVFAN